MASEMYYRNRKWPPHYIFDGVIYVSDFSRHIHEEIDARFRRINSISLYNCTSIGDQYTVPKCHDKYFLYYGRLSREKGLNTLISAFGKRPNLKLVIIGTGPLEDELRAQCSGVNNIEFL